MANSTTANHMHSETQTRDKREKELSEAIERVWQKYGRDLGAFQRDVRKELEKHAEGAPKD